MSMRMLVDAAHPEETRVAVIRGNRLEAFEFESASKKQLKGNIYLAKVTRVEPSLQAAFVDYGGNRHGFLAFNEIHPDYYQIPVQDRAGLIEEQTDSDDEDSNGEKVSDDGVESLGGEDDLDEDIKRRSRALRHYKIQEVIKRRQIILIQVVKEERGTKGAALTTYLSLAGRYCVLMPNTARGGGISRKIINPSDRKRLKGIATSFEVPQGMGVIIRTAGLNRTKPEIKRDYDYLLRTWNAVRELTLKSTAPCLVHEEGDLIRRGIRDLYNKDITEILVAGEEGYKAAKGFMKTLMPSQAKVVQPYRDNVPLFHKYMVEREIDEMYSPRVTLKSGAYIIINPTEALVAVDVNSGRSTKERNIEETAYRTNLEAAEEVARQVRLRDLAGLIVIDFIDMEVSKNVRAVEAKLKECLKGDRARIQVGRISSFGLMEMSRQRLRPDLIEASTNTCPSCAGTGLVRSTESAALALLRGVEDEGIREPGAVLTVDAPAEVAIYILNQKRAVLRELEERYNFRVDVRIDEALIAPDHRISRKKHEGVDGDEKPAVRQTKPIEAEKEKPQTDDEGQTDGRRRRRGRRRRPRDSNQDVAAENEIQNGTQVSEGSEAITEAAAEGAETASTKSVTSAAETEDAPAPRRRRRSRRGGRGRSRAATTAATETDAGTESQEILESTEALDTPTDNVSDVNGEVVSDAGEELKKSPARKRSTAVKKPRAASTHARKTTPRGKKVEEEPSDKGSKTQAVSASPVNAPSDDDDQGSPSPTTAPKSTSRPEPKTVSEPTPDVAVPLAASPVDGPSDQDAGAQEAADKPKRRGWWQRK